jgi:DNA gyrase subunit A
MRIVVVLKRDAVPSVVRNNLFKHTQLQDTFGCNMVALVDEVPRTLSLDGFVRHWIAHQIEVIQRRTRFRLRKAQERAHILRGYARALDQLDAVIELIRRSPDVDAARAGLITLLDIDELQAKAARSPRASADHRRARHDRADHRRARDDPGVRAETARDHQVRA